MFIYNLYISGHPRRYILLFLQDIIPGSYVFYTHVPIWALAFLNDRLRCLNVIDSIWISIGFYFPILG